MKNLMSLLIAISLFVGCDSIEENGAPLADEESASPPTHLGGCILRNPVNDVPSDVYRVSDIVVTDEFTPFSKKLSVYGLTLVARDDISDEFMRKVARAIVEIFPQDPMLDLEMQAKILGNHHSYNALIPIPNGEDFSFMENNEEEWAALESRNSICDIIMQDVPGQVMEVVEHILHYVTDIGLHYAYPDEWGISDNSSLAVAVREAVDKGYYDVSQYDDIDIKEVRNRVIQQEFAYWVVSTAWNLQEPYGPKNEQEWQIRDRDDLQAKLPDFFSVYERTVDRVMVAPSAATLASIGPTRAEEANQ